MSHLKFLKLTEDP